MSQVVCLARFKTGFVISQVKILLYLNGTCHFNKKNVQHTLFIHIFYKLQVIKVFYLATNIMTLASGVISNLNILRECIALIIPC